MTLDSSRYSVRVTKDHLVFSAAHFITIGDWCERLHGHNWRVAAEVSGPLDANEFVVDFLALRDQLQAIVDGLDHSMLVPLQHPRLTVEQTEQEVEIRFAERRWVFPRDECRLLPVRQTTAEALARWIAGELAGRLADSLGGGHQLRVDVEENFGQWATCEFAF
ncbi:MAG: 6-pyruvoyl tetrahydropterin synthase family protein [Planctomyces sp.]|nr:6-pyruvoyl tetrahydropterin synthase family protein [Planctomyces sp.]